MRAMSFVKAHSLALALLLLLVPWAASARTIGLADLRQTVSLSDPEISPDGARIVVLVSRANFENDRFDSDLVLVDVATGAQRVLTYDRDGLAEPRWSPNGDRLAFLARTGDPDDATEQIFVMPMDGGDATPVSAAKNGVEQFAWRPDGGAIAYVSPDDRSPDGPLGPHDNGFTVGDNDYLKRSAPVASHVWIVDADGGPARRLTSGTWSVPASEPPGPPASPLSWSADGKSIAITHLENAVYGDSDRSTVEIVDVATGAARKLTSHAALEGYPQISPDGSKVAYWYPRDGDPTAINSIWVAPAAGGDGTDVTLALDRHIVRAIWMPDGKSLLVAAHDGTRSAMWIQPLDGPARRVDTGDVNPTQAFWLDASVGADGAIAFTGSEPGHPQELWYLAGSQSAPKRLTDFNAALASLDLGQVQSIDWTAPDGTASDGVLTFPPGFVAAKKYPLVLVIHGGPNSASTTSWNGFAQVLAANGWIVFNPNYRGSDNLGNAYWRAIFNDAGDGPGRDVMAGVDAVEKSGFVDPSRLAVSGWSYGGYMTSWMTGHYPIWRAAVEGAAVDNLVDEYDLSDNNVTVRYGFPGFASPWTSGAMKEYVEQSPLTYARDVKAPTLILSDTGDARVPITQSFEMYHALKDNGVTTQFWAYPVDGHFPGDPVRAEDVYRRWIAWFREYLR
jgi:dipeptidyl aminopeptidase/acylaminoacyl peptidase